MRSADASARFSARSDRRIARPPLATLSPSPCASDFDAVSGARYHMHHVEAGFLQFLQQLRKRGDRARVNVVQEQNSLAARLQPRHGATDDFARPDPAIPIVGDDVGAEDDQRACGELCSAASERPSPGKRKKGASSFWIAERRPYIGNTLVDLQAQLLDRQFFETRWMVFGMGADGVAGLIDTANNGRDIPLPWCRSGNRSPSRIARQGCRVSGWNSAAMGRRRK